MLIFKGKIFLLHVHSCYIYGNTTFYYVNGASYIVEICSTGISTTIRRTFYVLVKYETNSSINSMQTIYYIGMNVILTVLGGYKYGLINNKPVITED